MRNIVIFVTAFVVVGLLLWGFVGFISFSWSFALWNTAGRLAFVVAWLGFGIPFAACATDEFIASRKKGR